MPLPYSMDLRERVPVAYEPGAGTAALARRFRVALNTVKNWVRAAERAGRRVAKPRGHGPEPRLGAAERAVLRRVVAADMMPPWPNMARDRRRRPGSGSAGQGSVSPLSAWA
jgi:transposase